MITINSLTWKFNLKLIQIDMNKFIYPDEAKILPKGRG